MAEASPIAVPHGSAVLPDSRARALDHSLHPPAHVHRPRRKCRSVVGVPAALHAVFRFRLTAGGGLGRRATLPLSRCVNMHSKTTGIMIGVAVGVLSGALSIARAHADEGAMQRTSPTT